MDPMGRAQLHLLSPHVPDCRVVLLISRTTTQRDAMRMKRSIPPADGGGDRLQPAVPGVAGACPPAAGAAGPCRRQGGLGQRAPAARTPTADHLQRRQPELLLGELRRVPAVGAGRPGQQHAHRPGAAQGARRPGARAPRRCRCRAATTARCFVHGASARRRTPSRRRGQHGHRSTSRPPSPRTCGPTSPPTPAGRAAQMSELRSAGRRRRHGNLAAGKASRRVSHADVYARATPSTATQTPTGRAPTTPSRSGSRSTSAPPSPCQPGGAEAAAGRRVGAPARRRSPSRAAPTASTFTDLVASRRLHLQPGHRQHGDHHLHTPPPPATSGCTSPANTGWPAGQISEFEVYGPATGDTRRRPRRRNLAYTQPATGQIRLTWSASTDNVGVTGYDVYANGALRTSVAGNVLTYTDSQPDTRDGRRTTCGPRTRPATSRRTATPSPVPAPPATPRRPTAPGEPGLHPARHRPDQADLERVDATTSAVTGYEVYANGTHAAPASAAAR